jgi:hypothetical protein
MKEFGKFVLVLIFMAVGGVIGKAVVQGTFDSPRSYTAEEKQELMQKALDDPDTDKKIQESWESLKASAGGEDDPEYAEKLAKSSESMILDRSSTLESLEDKAALLSGTIIGAYLMQAKTRKSFCQQYGIDISPFINAYYRRNQDIVDKADRIFSQHGMTMDMIYPKIKAQQVEFMQSDMSGIRDELGVNNYADACAAFNEYKSEIADNMALEKVTPDIVNQFRQIPEHKLQ